MTYAKPDPRIVPAAAPQADAQPGRAAAAAVSPYLKSRVLTATPEQLQLMLFDGAIRFAEQGRAALLERDFGQSHDRIGRAQRIVTELQGGLRHDVMPEVCGRLSALYEFAYVRLVEANLQHDVERLDEAVKVLKYQRETWSLVMREVAGGGGQAADSTPPGPAAPRLSLAG